MACSGNTNQPMPNHKTGEGELKGLRIGELTHDRSNVGIKSTAMVFFCYSNMKLFVCEF